MKTLKLLHRGYAAVRGSVLSGTLLAAAFLGGCMMLPMGGAMVGMHGYGAESAGHGGQTGGAGAFGSHFAVGVVQQVDRAARVVTLMHEPVVSLNWPAMSMRFAVADAALFERLPAGRQVAFEFVERGGDYRIVNAIPLAQAGSDGQQGMHGNIGGGAKR